MASPAGIRIRRWFGVLVGLLLAADLATLAGSLAISRSVRFVVTRAEPLATATAAIRAEGLAAQRDLFRFLAGWVSDTSPALAHLEAASLHVRVARAAVQTDPLARSLDEIDDRIVRYRQALERMPATREERRQERGLPEYAATAIELGNAVEQVSAALAEAAQQEIRSRSDTARRAAAAATWTSAGIFALSIVILLALRRAWRHLQDLLLEI